MGLNVFDIVVIVVIALGAVFGILSSKFEKKISQTLAFLIPTVTLYFISGNIATKVSNFKMKLLGDMTVFEWIRDKIQSVESIKNVYDRVPLMDELILCMIKILVFFILGLIGILVFKLIFGIISGIFFKNRHGFIGRILSLVFGVVNGVAFSLFLLFPIISIYPLTSNFSELTDSLELDSLKNVSEKIESATENSIVIKLYKENLDKNKIGFLKYKNSKVETDTKEYYFIDELDGTVNLAIFTLKLNAKNEEKGILTLTEEELDAMFGAISDSGTAKEVLGGVIEEFGLDVDMDKLDLSTEGKTIAYVLNIAQTESYDDIDVDELVENIFDSPLIITIAETNEGILSDVDDETESLIKEKLEEKVANGTLLQDDMDSLMYLFTPKEIAEKERND